MNNKPDDVVICSAVRTPIGTYKGSLKDLKGDQLGTIVINEVLKRSKISNNQIDEVIMGQVLTAGGGQNPARQAAVNAGIPVSKPAYLVNQVCGSGLRAIISGYQQIKLGDANNVICGGQENMSMTPYSYFYSEKKEISKDQLINTMIHDGLTDAFKNYHMGVTAENVAKKFNISRKEQQDFAISSHSKANSARETNMFDNEIVSITNNDQIINKDGGIRPNTSHEILDGLKLAFDENGTVTAGTASPLTDGAAAVIVCEEEYANKNNLNILARIKSTAVVGCPPELMGLGPINASKKALKRADLSIDDIDVVELNEAFASQSLACIRELNMDIDKVNIHGGAIALGHPLGATGARITGKVATLLKNNNKKYGLATQCIGAGQGIATVLENIN